MPHSPQRPQQQHAPAKAEPLLQNRGQIIAPAVFLPQKRQEGEKEVRDEDQKIHPGNITLPVCQICGPVFRAGKGRREKDHPGLERHKEQTDPNGAPQFAPPAQAIGLPLFFPVGQQQDPAQHRPGDQNKIPCGKPDYARPDHRQEAQRHAGRGGYKMQDVKPAGQLRPAGQKKGQHHPGCRVHHLGIGKEGGIIARPLADGKRNSHQIGHPKSNNQKKGQFPFGCFNLRIHGFPPRCFPAVDGVFCTCPPSLAKRKRPADR